MKKTFTNKSRYTYKYHLKIIVLNKMNAKLIKKQIQNKIIPILNEHYNIRFFIKKIMLNKITTQKSPHVHKKAKKSYQYTRYQINLFLTFKEKQNFINDLYQQTLNNIFEDTFITNNLQLPKNTRIMFKYFFKKNKHIEFSNGLLAGVGCELGIQQAEMSKTINSLKVIYNFINPNNTIDRNLIKSKIDILEIECENIDKLINMIFSILDLNENNSK